MAFTTAGTATLGKTGEQLFQGLFSNMFAITIVGADPALIAAGAEDIQNYTVTGLALGDMVLGLSFTVSQTIDGDINAYVSAANTLTIRISNLNAAGNLDYGVTTISVLIGRPRFA